MSLTGALHIGRTALTASQTALDVTGNNLANVATDGYTRQRVELTPGESRQIGDGMFLGNGVRVGEINRMVNAALNERLRSASGDHEGAIARQQVLSQLESVHNELSDAGLTQRVERFFDAWSQLASNPTDTSLQNLVISEGESLANFAGTLRREIVDVRDQVDKQLDAGVADVNKLLDRVAELNTKITRAEAGQGGAHALRDERDRVLKDLAEYVDISTVEQSSGALNVHVGSTAVVQADRSLGVKLEFQPTEEGLTPRLRVGSDDEPLKPSSGKLAALMQARTQDVDESLATLDGFMHELMYQVNQVHSSGQGTAAFESLTSTAAAKDPDAALDAAGLPFAVRNGSFELHVRQQSTGERETHRIEIDLGNNGETTLNDVVAAIDSIEHINASLGADGRLTIDTSSSDFRFSFADDNSGLLAAIGLNTFFAGSDASDMAVNPTVRKSPEHLAVTSGHVAGGNGTAKAMADLIDKPVAELNGMSLRQTWSRHTEDYAARTAEARSEVEATGMVAEGLQNQWQSESGVNLDEEAINMLAYQRMYQGAARFIGVVDQLMQTLLAMGR